LYAEKPKRWLSAMATAKSAFAIRIQIPNGLLKIGKDCYKIYFGIAKDSVVMGSKRYWYGLRK